MTMECKTFSIIKPNNNGTGNVVQFSISKNINKDKKEYKPECVFAQFSKQKAGTKVEDARFDYENGVKVKLSANDIAGILLVLTKAAKENSIIHKFKGNTTSVKTVANSDTKYKASFFINVERREDGKENSQNKVNIGLNDNDATILTILLKKAICNVYGW